jgi:hypothetical protein
MITSDARLGRTKLTFSQAEGLVALPSQLRLGEISAEFRSLLWAHLVSEFRRTMLRGTGLGSVDRVGGPWRIILYDANIYLYHKPADEFDSTLKDVMRAYKHLVWEGAFNEIFDFLQFVMRHPEKPSGFVPEIGGIFRRSRAAYAVIPDGPTIIPIGSDEEVKALAAALNATTQESLRGARAHLRLAAEALTAGRYGDSVRDSMHAVESTARVLSKDSKATLAEALHELKSKLGMHPAFKKGLLSLYGYSSDEAGIRHSLLEDEARVDMHDALFMLGACASFVTLLIGKGRAADIVSSPS